MKKKREREKRKGKERKFTTDLDSEISPTPASKGNHR